MVHANEPLLDHYLLMLGPLVSSSSSWALVCESQLHNKDEVNKISIIIKCVNDPPVTRVRFSCLDNYTNYDILCHQF